MANLSQNQADRNNVQTVYAVNEDFSGPQEFRPCMRMSMYEILGKVQDGEIERVQVQIRKFDGRIKHKWIWRCTSRAFWFRGSSCSAGPEYVQRLAQNLDSKKPNWASETLEFFKFRMPVVEV